jgi:ATP-dependent helicase/nuclease subunit B
VRLVEDLCRRAVERAQAQRVVPLPQPLLANEAARLRRRLEGMLDCDRERAAAQGFAVQVTEGEAQLALAGGSIRIRLDRLDRLDDGSLIVIDYKSGQARPLDLEDERPTQPQLAAYALLAGDAVAAVAAVHLEPTRVAWRGLEARAHLLPGSTHHMRPRQPWPALLQQWHEVLSGLAGEFLRGEAAVDPQEGACRHCGLESLCRVGAAQHHTELPESALAVAQPDDPADVAVDDGGSS